MRKNTFPFLLTAALAAQASVVPQGWQREDSQGFATYTPAALQGQVMMVIALDPLPLGGASLGTWAEQAAKTLSQSYGQLENARTAQEESGLWRVTHQLQSQDGKALFAQYFAREENGQGRMVVMLGEVHEGLIQAYGETASALAATLLQGQVNTRLDLAREGLGQRGHAHIQSGKPFVFGTYHCKVENGRFPYDVLLQLYENGEYRSDRKDDETGTFTLDPVTQTIKIESDWHLYDMDLGESIRYVSVYARDKNGAPILYGEDWDEGEATVCVHLGNVQAPSPSDEKAAKAEESRFKWTTAPNQGVQMNEIEALIHHAKHVNDAIGSRLEESHVLLLQDGWAYSNLQVPPADLDVRASRDNESAAWRRWKKEGGEYFLEKADNWEKIDGQPARPAARGETLSGTYKSHAMYGNIYTSVSVYIDSLYFNPDGTLSSHSSMRGGTTALNSGTFSANVASDSADDAPLHYALDGYTLIRRDGEGRETRSLAFFWGEGQKHINIGGTTYSKEE